MTRRPAAGQEKSRRRTHRRPAPPTDRNRNISENKPAARTTPSTTPTTNTVKTTELANQITGLARAAAQHSANIGNVNSRPRKTLKDGQGDFRSEVGRSGKHHASRGGHAGGLASRAARIRARGPTPGRATTRPHQRLRQRNVNQPQSLSPIPLKRRGPLNEIRGNNINIQPRKHIHGRHPTNQGPPPSHPPARRRATADPPVTFMGIVVAPHRLGIGKVKPRSNLIEGRATPSGAPKHNRGNMVNFPLTVVIPRHTINEQRLEMHPQDADITSKMLNHTGTIFSLERIVDTAHNEPPQVPAGVAAHTPLPAPPMHAEQRSAFKFGTV
jgi:hypothetical protein